MGPEPPGTFAGISPCGDNPDETHGLSETLAADFPFAHLMRLNMNRTAGTSYIGAGCLVIGPALGARKSVGPAEIGIKGAYWIFGMMWFRLWFGPRLMTIIGSSFALITAANGA